MKTIAKTTKFKDLHIGNGFRFEGATDVLIKIDGRKYYDLDTEDEHIISDPYCIVHNIPKINVHKMFKDIKNNTLFIFGMDLYIKIRGDEYACLSNKYFQDSPVEIAPTTYVMELPLELEYTV